MRDSLRAYLFSATAIVAVLAQPSAALARSPVYRFNIPAQGLGNALKAFGETSRQQIIFDAAAVNGKKSPALVGSFTKEEALAHLLAFAPNARQRLGTRLAAAWPGKRDALCRHGFIS